MSFFSKILSLVINTKLLVILSGGVDNNFDCTTKIREQAFRYGTPYIIAITANAYNEDLKRCLEVGMNDFVAKPIEFELLNKAISKFILNLVHD